MNIEKLALYILKHADNGKVSEQIVMDVSDNNDLSLLEFTNLCDILSEIGITIIPKEAGIGTIKLDLIDEGTIYNDIFLLFSKLSIREKKKVYNKMGTLIKELSEEKEETEKEQLFKNVKTFSDFCVVLDKCNYNITLDKKSLIEKSQMTPIEYNKLKDELSSLSIALKKYRSDILVSQKDCSKVKKKNLDELIEKDRCEVYNNLKVIMSFLSVTQKCRNTDIDYLSEHCILLEYRDKDNPKLGYVLKERGTLHLLNQILKVLSKNRIYVTLSDGIK